MTLLARKDIDINTFGKIVDAYEINTSPEFIAQVVFGATDDYDIEAVQRYLEDENFLAIAEAKKFNSEISKPQTIKEMRVSYQILLANIRQKLARDVIGKINQANNEDRALKEQDFRIKAIGDLFKLELLLHGLPTDLKGVAHIHKFTDDNEFTYKEAEAQMRILDRSQNSQTFLDKARRGQKVEEAQLVKPAAYSAI